jgi:hypothetical protein
MLPIVQTIESKSLMALLLLIFLFFVEYMQCLKRICEFKTDFISSFVIIN